MRRINYLFLVICAISAASITGCKDPNEGKEPPVTVSDDELTLDATIAAYETKAVWSSSAGKAEWESSDELGVFVGSNVNAKLTRTKEGKFYAKLGSAPEETAAYYAYYPYASGTTLQDKTIEVTIPSTQTYSDSGFPVPPMVASYNGKISDAAMTFHHAFAILKLSTMLEEDAPMAYFNSVNVIGNDSEILAGDATIDMTDVSNTMAATVAIDVNFTNGVDNVTLDCGDGISVSSSSKKDFYVIIPAGEYAAGFTITYTAGSATSTFNYEEPLSVARGTIVPIDVTLTTPLEKLTFTAKTGALVSPSSALPAGLDGTAGSITWNENEYIGFFSNRNINTTLSQISGSMSADGTSASYEGGILKIDTDETVIAYYPYHEETTYLDGELLMNISDTQLYAPDGIGSPLHMVATYTGSPEGEQVDFQNIMGFLKVSVTVPNEKSSMKIKSIQVENFSTKEISGSTLLDLSTMGNLADTDPIPFTVLSGSNIAKLDCGDGVTLEVGVTKDFYFALLPVSLGWGFNFDCFMEDGSQYSAVYMLLGTEVVIERNKTTEVSLTDLTKLK